MLERIKYQTIEHLNSPLFNPGKIGDLTIGNRFIRSAVSETLADESGLVHQPLYTDFYERLAEGGAGLLFTGHCYVEDRGRYTPGMTGLTTGEHAVAMSQSVDAVHALNVPIFVQLNHAGSQSRVPSVTPLAASAVSNAQTGREPEQATEADIQRIISAYRRAAGLARSAGFDGIHIHAGHGYLLSSFLSPYSNRRDDQWGGSLSNRQRLLLDVVRAVIQGGGGLPVTVKLGMRDFVEGGLQLEDALDTAELIVGQEGVAAIEVSAGITSPKIETAQQYTAVDRRRAFQDRLVHRLFSKRPPEGYFVNEARALRQKVDCPVILVGGLRTVEFMESVVSDGAADFVSLGRPLIREPRLVADIRDGRRGIVDCTSCNICLMHEGVHPLRCWRTSIWLLLKHAYYRLSGQLLYK